MNYKELDALYNRSKIPTERGKPFTIELGPVEFVNTVENFVNSTEMMSREQFRAELLTQLRPFLFRTAVIKPVLTY